MPVAHPAWRDTLLQRLGMSLVPIALVLVGLQLRLRQMQGRLPPLGVGLGFKLLIGPDPRTGRE